MSMSKDNSKEALAKEVHRRGLLPGRSLGAVKVFTKGWLQHLVHEDDKRK